MGMRGAILIYLSGALGPGDKFSHPNLGFMMTPDMGNRVPGGDCRLGADNACFNNPENYSDERYEKFLHKMPRQRTLFATAPDVVGDHEATVAKSIPMLRRLRFLGFKPAFIAQDGWEEDSTPWNELECLFVGGSTEF